MTRDESMKLRVGDGVVFSDGVKGEVIFTGSSAVGIEWKDGLSKYIDHKDMQEVSRGDSEMDKRVPAQADTRRQIQRHIAYEVERGREIQAERGSKQQEQSQERSNPTAVVIGLSTVKSGKQTEEPEQAPGRER